MGPKCTTEHLFIQSLQGEAKKIKPNFQFALPVRTSKTLQRDPVSGCLRSFMLEFSRSFNKWRLVIRPGQGTVRLDFLELG